MQAFPWHRYVLRLMVSALLAMPIHCLHAQMANRIATPSRTSKLSPQTDGSASEAKKKPAPIGRPTIDPQLLKELPMPCIQSWDSLDLPENERPIVHSSPRRISAQTVSRRTPADELLDDVDSPSDKDDLLTDDDELLPAPNKSSSNGSNSQAAGSGADKPKPLGKGLDTANDSDDPLAGMGPATGGIKSEPLEPVSPIWQRNSGDSTDPWSSCIHQLKPALNVIRGNTMNGGSARMLNRMSRPRFIVLNRRCRT